MLFLSVLFVCFQFTQLSSQLVIQPSIESKTHPSMTIDSIVMTEMSTTCYFQIENQNTEGNAWFCADKDILLVELSTGRKHQLIKASGIPVCPDVYNFKHAGERLFFNLEFPAIEYAEGEIDIIEQCADNCFSFKNIILDVALNEEIRLFENGVSLFQQEKYREALSLFGHLKNSAYKEQNHYAYTRYIIPVIHFKLGDKKNAKSSYIELKAAVIPQKQYFLNKIHEIPFFRDLNK